MMMFVDVHWLPKGTSIALYGFSTSFCMFTLEYSIKSHRIHVYIYIYIIPSKSHWIELNPISSPLNPHKSHWIPMKSPWNPFEITISVVSKPRSSPPWWEYRPPHPAGSQAAAWQHLPQPSRRWLGEFEPQSSRLGKLHPDYRRWQPNYYTNDLCNKTEHNHYTYIAGWWLGHPSEKYESQLGWLFPIYGKIKLMFQTTNQITTIE